MFRKLGQEKDNGNEVNTIIISDDVYLDPSLLLSLLLRSTFASSISCPSWLEEDSDPRAAIESLLETDEEPSLWRRSL